MSLSLVVLMVVYYRGKARMARRIAKVVREMERLSQQGRKISGRLSEEQRLRKIAGGVLIGIDRGYLTEQEKRFIQHLSHFGHD